MYKNAHGAERAQAWAPERRNEDAIERVERMALAALLASEAADEWEADPFASSLPLHYAVPA